MSRADTTLKLRLFDLYLGLPVLVRLVQTAYFFSFELVAPSPDPHTHHHHHHHRAPQ